MIENANNSSTRVINSHLYTDESSTSDTQQQKLRRIRVSKEKVVLFEDLMEKGYEYRTNGKFKDGINSFLKAMEIKTTGSLLKGLGYCYMGLKNFDEAIKFFEKAIEVSSYQKKMLPKYIELCRMQKRSFNECTQDEINEIYLKAEK